MKQTSHSILQEIETLGRDEDSLNYLEWKIDQFHSEQRKFDHEILGEHPDLLKIEEETRLVELFCFLDYFEEREEYEKCARIKKLIDNISVTP